MKALLISLIIVSFIVITCGALFKIQHWPGANLVMITGMLLEPLSVILLVLYLTKKKQAPQPNDLRS